MHRKISAAIWILALALMTTTLLIFACADSGDDDDNDDNNEATPDLNGWADEDGTLTFQDDNNQQCPPPLPEGMSEKPLQIILDAYMGQYLDEFGNERSIECYPQGLWEAPNYCPVEFAFCDSLGNWRVPVYVTIVEQDLPMIGFISKSGNPSVYPGELYYDFEDQTIFGAPFEPASGDFKIVFVDPTFGAVWTKEK